MSRTNTLCVTSKTLRPLTNWVRIWKKHGVYQVWPVNGRRYKYWFAGDGFRYWLIGWPSTRTPGANRTRIEDSEIWFAEQIKQAAETKALAGEEKKVERRKKAPPQEMTEQETRNSSRGTEETHFSV